MGPSPEDGSAWPSTCCLAVLVGPLRFLEVWAFARSLASSPLLIDQPWQDRRLREVPTSIALTCGEVWWL